MIYVSVSYELLYLIKYKKRKTFYKKQYFPLIIFLIAFYTNIILKKYAKNFDELKNTIYTNYCNY